MTRRLVSLPREGSRAERRLARARLERVGRVRAPEFDMRACLPRRAQLLGTLRTSSSRRELHRSEHEKHLSKLSGRAVEAACAGDAKGLQVALHMANNGPSIMPVLLAVARQGDTISLSTLASLGVLSRVEPPQLSAVLDASVRSRLRQGDIDSAFNMERFSRALQIGLRRGTYTALMRASGDLRITLALLRRAATMHVRANAAMFNAVLSRALEHGNGSIARGVLAAMSEAGIRPNGDTIDILLRHAHSVRHVDAVVGLLKAENGPVLQIGHGSMFIRAYLRMGCDTAIARCFSLVQWAYSERVGVTSDALNAIIEHCAHTGRLEGALHAWREMRRAWFGRPSTRACRALLKATKTDNEQSRARRLVYSRLGNL